ncbi:MBL fold metallo-hydrolase [Enterovirga rhinocerotis]|uniref:Glyoxylase-like metal-dependent hydrolase (Beta-lactamase superfamily II) n=1 Tax=Enterovirga rhinocerotis TaxID=1339210 RepID=A0A4R7C006_9HYPH|nr:MBL fold metallo-hydrolase [Enterovirga rhinocerotis]TDR90375.1 glyoxylase-like metal-dependent hydrolase (beta-lactamase superfamily II) [Enterovirga rhinocerotis]
MMQTRMIGEARVTRVLEYAAPTHDPAFLFPDLDPATLAAKAEQVAPHHYMPHMNRLIVTIQLWIVQAGGNVIVIDTGVGNAKPRGAARMNMLNSLVPAWLEAAGAAPHQVTHVVQTHMHSDHVGWNTILSDGHWVPTFPNARYLMPKRDFEYYRTKLASEPDALIDASFADSVMPVIEAGLVDFVEDDAGEIAGCLAVEPAPGHSHGMLTYRLRSRGEQGLFSADVMHSPLQILLPELNTGYCALPDEARRTRARVLADAADNDVLLMPMHFGAPHCGYVRRQGDGYRFEPATWPETA